MKYLWVVFLLIFAIPAYGEDCEIQSKDIKAILERCREFVKKDEVIESYVTSNLVYKRIPSGSVKVQMEIDELKEKKEKIEREDQLRRDIEKMIETLSVGK